MQNKTENPAALRGEKRIEILAPVGSPQTLEAAVWAGADSVYLGLQGFNARRGAGNFTPEELKDAVRLCHAHGVNVHVTLNTLVRADELPAVQRALEAVCAAGADAVLVQDWAVARLVRQCAPGLKLHASTQLAVCDAAGALAAAAHGFSRVVLARELSGAEIAHITQVCGIETEAFIHGAQCMSVSGQCYMSAFLGGRSGNRGGCAQPCRLPCAAFTDAKPPAKTAQNTGCNHLSLKDMSALAHLPELEAMGVASVKIEGRLRGPEYVAAVVHAARLARDGQPYDEEELRSIFSRSGFTDGYFTAKRSGAMFGMRTAEDAAAARAAAPRIREYYRRPLPRAAVDMALELDADGAKLTVSDGVHKAAAYDTAPAQGTPGESYPAALKKSLCKTGGTPFYTKEEHIALAGAQEYFLPLARINELRRTALDTLYEKRASARRVEYRPWAIPAELCAPVGREPVKDPAAGWRDEYGRRMLVGRFESPRQVPQGLDALFHRMVFPLRSAGEIPQEWRGKTVLEIPRGNFGASDKLAAAVAAACKAGFNRFEVTNIGHLQLLGALGSAPDAAGEKPELWAGWSMNILNPLAAQELAALGVTTRTVSCELPLAALPLFKAGGVRTAVLAYGRLPVMMTRACPLHNVTDCESCPKRGRLLDRKGEQLPVVCRGSVREIFNPIPLWLGDRQDECDCDLLTLYFTWESPERVRAVTELFRAGAPFDGRFTRGLYYGTPDGI